MDRATLKNKAKQVLAKNYWAAVFACIIFSMLTGEASTLLSSVSTILPYDDADSAIVDQIGFTQSNTLGIIADNVAFWAAVGLLILFYVFFVNPLTTGKANFFLKAREDGMKARYALAMFKGEAYTNSVKALFMRNLFVFLGYLLIVPGIYLSYSYYFVPQIVAENPSTNWKDALNKSKEITKGHKFELFVLELSFLGWIFLGALVIIGGYLVQPYIEATKTEAYISLKHPQNEPEINVIETI